MARELRDALWVLRDTTISLPETVWALDSIPWWLLKTQLNDPLFALLNLKYLALSISFRFNLFNCLCLLLRRVYVFSAIYSPNSSMVFLHPCSTKS